MGKREDGGDEEGKGGGGREREWRMDELRHRYTPHDSSWSHLPSFHRPSSHKIDTYRPQTREHPLHQFRLRHLL